MKKIDFWASRPIGPGLRVRPIGAGPLGTGIQGPGPWPIGAGPLGTGPLGTGPLGTGPRAPRDSQGANNDEQIYENKFKMLGKYGCLASL